MASSLGKLTGILCESSENITSELIDLINANVNPPTPVTRDEVYVRAMYIVSDEVNSYGGCFQLSEHGRMAELLIDSPVMVGHRKDKLPVGRNFHASLSERDGKNWIKSYFYWLKSAEGAENLKDNIDGGVYKECSIGFTFHLPECSICGKDIRLCAHEPFEKYAVDGEEVVCHFNYRQIERVLETSLVYRGAIRNTSISNELKAVVISPVRLDSTDLLADDKRYLVVPRYEGLPVTIERESDSSVIRLADGNVVSDAVARKFALERLTGESVLQARLVGYRGKERCRADQVRAYLLDGSGPVSRLVLWMLPVAGCELSGGEDSRRVCGVRMIPHRWASKEDLVHKAREIRTRAGVEVLEVGEASEILAAFEFEPDSSIGDFRPRDCWLRDSETGEGLLVVDSEGFTGGVVVCGFDPELLCAGRRFVGDLVSDDNSSVRRGAGDRLGTVTAVHGSEGGLVAELEGELNGRVLVRPIMLDGRERFLVYGSGASLRRSGSVSV